jgi:hypothetical protein
LPIESAEVTQVATPEFKLTSLQDAMVAPSILKVTEPPGVPAGELTEAVNVLVFEVSVE